MPGDEWLLDNYHIARDTVTEIKVDLPRGYYLQLPRLNSGEWAGYPRVYAAVCELILHTDGIVDSANVDAFVKGYQSGLAFNIGELWALPAMIRLVLVENLARFAEDIVATRYQLESANRWADQLVDKADDTSTLPGTTIDIPGDLRQDARQLTRTFVVRLLQRLRDAGPALTPVMYWLETELAKAGLSPEEAIRAEFTRQSALQASVGNTISSMRRVSAANWADFVESHSAIEALLRTDPAGIYPRMDFATRDRYRHVVERIARRSGVPETAVAEEALRLAKEGEKVEQDKARHGHVGYYLVARGVHELRAAMGYRSRLGELLSRSIRGYPTKVYVGSILALTGGILGIAYLFGFEIGGTEAAARVHPLLTALALLIAIVLTSEIATRLVNTIVTLLLPPRVLPKLDLSHGIPAEFSTFVVIPTLIKREEDIHSLIQHIEVIYLANQDPNLRFAILSDFADAPQEDMPGDTELVQAARGAVEGLNTRYGSADRFYLFHRKRQWNPAEGVWMGWERKRGKLADFNALLRNRGGESFTTRVGDPEPISRTSYVITLDTDTDLPRGAAHRLVGTLAHPLNRAVRNPETGTVAVGYGILQPRVETTWESAGKTLFSRLFSGHTGVDPYTTAVSNAYQDLFGEGIFIGKGIYDVDAFEEATRGVFPTNAILSHDLLEGTYARAGLASDIELYDDIPTRYNEYAARSHRWVRGDWQIAGWLRSTVPTDGGRAPNPLSAINRWKIADNLRRSLVAPASLLLLAMGWVALSPVFWTLLVVVVVAYPFYSHLITALPRKPIAASWPLHISVVVADAATNLLHLLLTFTFMAHTAYLMVDALVRTLVRMNITHRHLLEWVTASEAQRTLGSSVPDYFKRMWQAPAIAAVIAVSLLVWRPETLVIAAPFLAAWVLSPLIAYLVSKPFVVEEYTVTEDDQLYLRRTARKSWRYFEEFIGPQDSWLAPDNYQEDPKGVLAHRTSPTNMSLLLLSTLSAYDMGYITIEDLAARLDRTLLSMERLEKYRGHFYNWYDTVSGRPLHPQYISTVDSGNLVGHLLALKNGCAEMLDAPFFSMQQIRHLGDLLELIRSEIEALAAERRAPLYAAQVAILDDFLDRVEDIRLQTESVPNDLGGWAELIVSLIQPTADMANDVRRLAGSRGWETLPGTAANRQGSGDELAYWTDSLARAVQSLDQQRRNYLSWIPMLESPPALLVDEKFPGIAASWADLKKLPDYQGSSAPSLSLIMAWNARCMAAIRRLRSQIQAAEPGEDGSVALRWLERLSQRVSASLAAGEVLSGLLGKLVVRADDMVREMNFDFLYDEARKLFVIGYNVSELRRDNSYYDLLATEARLASYIAIAKGTVPQEHWFRMGRPITGQGAQRTRDIALISWTGTMFEYMMPNLVMPTFKGSLFDQTFSAVVRYHERYGRQNSIPWGISESAYNALDSERNYRYKAFGLPELGLKRGLSEDLVVAPYATQLALAVDPRAALANLRRLSSLGMEGRYGFYDAIDFTRSRLAANESGAIVRNYMVHHLGMGLVAVNNFLNGDPMVRRFEAEPEVRATLLLLQERVPHQAPAVQTHPIGAERERMQHEETPPVVRNYDTPNTDVPRAHLISNGRYTVMVTNSGAGWSKWSGMNPQPNRAMAVTRWRDDWVRDAYGTFIYLRDTGSGAVWSAAAAPFGGQPSGYSARMGLDKAEFFRRDGDMETALEIVVSPEDDAEIRRVTLTNRGSVSREIELTSYAEIALAEQAADEAHPAFSKLFIETEYVEGPGALLASRRPRSASDKRNWLLHVVAVVRPDGDAATMTTGALGSTVPEEYETDRMAFLGRGGAPGPLPPLMPRAIVGGHRLENSSGAVLDPIFSLRQKVRIAPGMRVQVAFVTAAASSREDAIALSDKYHDPAWAERAVRMALSQARLELRMLDVSVDEAMQYQRLFSRMVYPRKATSPADAILARNSRGQQGLWAYSISGDLPILLVRIADPLEAPLARQALRAHEFWLRNGFEADLVLLNEYPGGYIQPVQEELERLVASSHAHNMINKPGGVFVKRADVMPEADIVLLNSVARVVLVGSRGTLAAQLDREVQSPPLPQALRITRPAVPVPARSRAEANEGSYAGGEFSDDGREYVVTLEAGQSTPLPWSNVITNYRFGALLTVSGMSSTWSENSRENRLTPWSNDPVSDPPSEVVYVRDEESGEVSTPTPLPIRDAGSYTIRHGQGYSIYSHTANEIEQTLRVSVPPDDPVKICKLTLRNASSRHRKLSATYYAELVLGVSRETVSRYIVTEADNERGAIYARNAYNPEFAERVAFATSNVETYKFTTDRAEFLGRNGSAQYPAALRRTGLSGRVGAGLNSCIAIQCAVEMEPGEERSVTFVLGQAENGFQARDLAGKYHNAQPNEAGVTTEEAEYQGTHRMWDWLLSAVEVETPDREMNLLLNRWILYQSISCRLWGRTAFYQSGGAYGFRDQLQDVMALMYAAPNIAREQILRCAEHQFKEGDVQHWWHPPTGRGVRTRFSDDLLWLPFVTAFYVKATGDTGILDEGRAFLQAPLLAPDQEDMYGSPTVSDEVGTLYEHCMRAIKHGTTAGEHGLPLMGAGDWNDGMNRVGIEGKGESVWLGWFLYAVLDSFAPVCELRGEQERAAELRSEMERLKEALEAQAWDGEWYLRAFYDNGTPLGSSGSEECRIDAISQSWAVISGAAPEERAQVAMRSVEKHLVREEDNLILLLTPAFDKTEQDPGYIKGYLPGVRENGGQYTHAAIWTAIAHVMMGDGDGAYRLFRMLNPMSHTRTPDELERYKTEPYVIAADIYSHPQHMGRGGWTWYTGSASWFYRLGVEYMLGLKLHGDHFTVEPCILSEWAGYSINFRYKSSHYRIRVDNSKGAVCEVEKVELDGEILPDRQIPLIDDGGERNVVVVMG